MHNCLVDSGAFANVMPLSVCKRKNGQPTPYAGKTIQLDRKIVKVVGRVFFKDSNIILKYSILGDCFGLNKTFL